MTQSHLSQQLLTLFALAGLLFLPRMIRRRVDPDGRLRSPFRLTGAAVGNAFQQLHTFMRPQAQHAIAASFDQADEEQDADPTDPAQHLQRQLKRIRNGEELDHITTLLR